MRGGMVVGMLLALGCAASACRCENVLPAGQMPLELTLWTVGKPSSDTLVVRVSAGTLAGLAGRGVVRITVPEGLALLAGDTTFTVPVGRVVPPRILKFHARGAGALEVRGSMTVAEKDSRDAAELLEVRLLLGGDTDSSGGRISEVVRAEKVLDGRRYRYGGLWLVPLEADEEYSLAELSRAGAGPRPSGQVIAYCHDCPLAADTVTFVVVIGRSGRVLQASPLASSVEAEAAERAARMVLSKTVFRPAGYRDKAVTDWAYVRIPVLRTPY